MKPNAEELARTTGCSDIAAGAAALRRGGAENVVASLGEDGLLADTTQGRWRAVLSHPVEGNPIGAGDAAVAALVAGLVGEVPWGRRLTEAVALSAAAVLEEALAGAVLPPPRR